MFCFFYIVQNYTTVDKIMVTGVCYGMLCYAPAMPFRHATYRARSTPQRRTTPHARTTLDAKVRWRICAATQLDSITRISLHATHVRTGEGQDLGRPAALRRVGDGTGVRLHALGGYSNIISIIIIRLQLLILILTTSN